jgi:topoisomerase-4 subunit A
MRFDDDMIVLEKWIPNKPLTVIYWEGEKELFYIKRFLIENPDKAETIITSHSKSYLEKIFTDFRPVAELVFAKRRGQERKDNQEVNLEEFIGIKGITAMGNQLTKEKVLEINALQPLPYEEPEKHEAKDIEVVDEENVIPTTKKGNNPKSDDPNDEDSKEGQTKLF